MGIFILNNIPMVRYALLTKKGEVINTSLAKEKHIAADYFARLKKISTKDLLKIYNVDVFIR